MLRIKHFISCMECGQNKDGDCVSEPFTMAAPRAQHSLKYRQQQKGTQHNEQRGEEDSFQLGSLFPDNGRSLPGEE